MKRRYHLTAPLLAFLVIALLLGLVSMNNQNNLLFWIFAVLVASLFISGIVSGFMMTGLRVRRLDPRHGAVGEPMGVRYRIENRNRLVPAFNVHIEDLAVAPRPWWRHQLDLAAAVIRSGLDFSRAIQADRVEQRRLSPATFWRLMKPAQALIMHVGPKETVHGEAVYWPLRRGEARFEYVRIWTTFPFGLVKKSITFHQPAHTLIHPRRYRLRPDVLAAVAPSGAMGMRSSQRAGVGDEYYGLREFRTGDPLRHIAWKRTANLDEIVCVERTQPSPPRLRVVLDCTAPVKTDSDRDLAERAISLVASIIEAADAADNEVGLSVLGIAMTPFPVRRGPWHVGRMLSALAAIDLDAPRRGGGRLPDVEQVGLVVVHPDRVTTGGGADTWHFTGRQLESLIRAPVGWDPKLNPELAAGPAEVAA